MITIKSARSVCGLLALVLSLASVGVAMAAPTEAAGINSQTFTTPGGPYTYTVPAGVSTVHADAIGGAGGQGSVSGPGGEGAEVSADLAVTPGQTLLVYVAGNGSTAPAGSSAGAGANGGGSPGGNYAGGGGGASDVRTTQDDLGSRLLVAAGGGGAAPAFGTAGAAEQEGTPGGGCDDTPSMPGTQTAGGAGGGGCGVGSGTDGGFGMGGNGGSFPDGGDYGGGGGSGWYGGGGGGAFGGGAGGSNHVTSTATNTTMSLTGSSPQVTISYTPGPATKLSLALTPAPIVADGFSTSTGTASIVDGNGNPVPGDTVTFSSSDPGEKIGPVTANGDGTYTATIMSSTTAGIATITATDTTAAPNATGSATLTQRPGPAAKVSVGLLPSSIPANGSSTSTATATVTDATDNPVAGDTVAFSSSDPGERIGPVTNGGGGTYTATITSSTTTGTATITANDTSVVPSVSGSAVLTQTAPVISKLADLKVAVTGASKAADGSTFTESVTVSNAGPAPATNVITGLISPVQLAVTNTGGGTRTGSAVSWTARSIASGQSATYTVTFKVAPRARGDVLVPVATGSTSVKDPNYLNNAAGKVITLG